MYYVTNGYFWFDLTLPAALRLFRNLAQSPSHWKNYYVKLCRWDESVVMEHRQ